MEAQYGSTLSDLVHQLAERTGGREKAVQVPGSSAWSHPPASCDARFHLPLFPSLPASAPRWLLGHELPIGDTCYMPASTTNSNTGRVASCRIASHRISSRRIASHRSVPSPVFHLAPPSVAVSARHRSVCLGGGPGADERKPDLLQPAKRDATISGTRIRIGRPRAHARGTCRHTAAEAETQPCGLVARLPSPDAIGQAPSPSQLCFDARSAARHAESDGQTRDRSRSDSLRSATS